MDQSNAKGHLLNLLRIAMADSELDPRELALIYEFAKRGGLEVEVIQQLLENPHQLRAHQPSSESELLGQLHDLAALVVADTKIDVREVAVLREVIRQYGVGPEKAQRLVEAVIDGVRRGVSRDAIIQELKS